MNWISYHISIAIIWLCQIVFHAFWWMIEWHLWVFWKVLWKKLRIENRIVLNAFEKWSYCSTLTLSVCKTINWRLCWTPSCVWWNLLSAFLCEYLHMNFSISKMLFSFGIFSSPQVGGSTNNELFTCFSPNI